MKTMTYLTEFKDFRMEELELSSNGKSNYVQSGGNGYWNGKKERLKQKFPIITDEDLCFNEGKEKEMIERLEYKLGKTKAELVSIIATL